jgi:type IV secretion system protein VirB5
MKVPTTIPVPAKTYYAAKRQYAEQYASVLVSANYLKIGLFAVSVVALGLLLLNIRTQKALESFKPLVIRIDDIGRAEAIKYEALEYRPRDAEIRYFLIQFVTKHYSRRRATVREDYAASLYFLDGRLADATIETNRKNRTIEKFLAGEGDEIDIQVKNVSIEDLRSAPYKASVDFEKVYFTAADHIEIRRERYVAHLTFIIKDRVANSIVPVNPLGLTITYFRQDQAFQ